MSPRPHEGPAEEGLSSSLLRIVQEPERVQCLRAALSDYCHRYRNALNGIKMSLYLFQREARGAVPDSLDDIEAIYRQIVRLFDHLQTIYRPMAMTMVRSTLDGLIHHQVPTWRSWFESRGLTVQLDPPESEVPADFDPAQLGIGLDALAAWRAESCAPATSTRIAWMARDGWIELRWEEIASQHPRDRSDLAGRTIPPEGKSAGRRLDLLELPLLARIVAEHGGRIHRTPGEALRLVLDWPQFQRLAPEREA